MTIIIRIAGALLGAVVGNQLAGELIKLSDNLARVELPIIIGALLIGAAVGALASVWLWRLFERAMAWMLDRLAHISLRDMAVGALGLGAGLVLAFLIGYPLSRIPGIGTYLALIAALVFGYLGLHLALQRRHEMSLAIGRDERPGRDRGRPRGIPKILDTSVIIDGRVADVVRTGFLEGPLMVPRSVLAELQRIAPIADATSVWGDRCVRQLQGVPAALRRHGAGEQDDGQPGLSFHRASGAQSSNCCPAPVLQAFRRCRAQRGAAPSSRCPPIGTVSTRLLKPAIIGRPFAIAAWTAGNESEAW